MTERLVRAWLRYFIIIPKGKGGTLKLRVLFCVALRSNSTQMTDSFVTVFAWFLYSLTEHIVRAPNVTTFSRLLNTYMDISN